MNIKWTLDKYEKILFLCGLSWIGSGVLQLFGTSGWISFFTLWTASILGYVLLAAQKIDVLGKAVLVTGCDSGFGFALAQHLKKMGFIVFAGCLFPEGEGAKALLKTHQPQNSGELKIIKMDVTSETDLQNARKSLEHQMPKGCTLWAIVNNAGMGTFGDLEWVPVSTFKKIADINVFGIISVTKAFLPLLRKSKGRIINVASMLGRMGVPMRSPYVLSKYAVEGLSDCLRHEMKPWGVDVIVLEPGNYIAGTNIFTEESVTNQGHEMWKEMSDEVRKDYGEEFFNSRVDIMKTYVTGGVQDITPVTEAFEEALTQKFAQARYQPMTLYYKTRIFVATHLPEWVYDNVYVGCLNK